MSLWNTVDIPECSPRPVASLSCFKIFCSVSDDLKIMQKKDVVTWFIGWVKRTGIRKYLNWLKLEPPCITFVLSNYQLDSAMQCNAVWPSWFSSFICLEHVEQSLTLQLTRVYTKHFPICGHCISPILVISNVSSLNCNIYAIATICHMKNAPMINS